MIVTWLLFSQNNDADNTKNRIGKSTEKYNKGTDMAVEKKKELGIPSDF